MTSSRRTSRPTLSDIARALDLSEATVSRALRGSPIISEQTRTDVARVARELGYVPNAAARSLARQASHTLGLLVPDVTDPVHGMIVAGFGQAAAAAGYTVLMLDGVREDRRRASALRTLREHQAQGVAFCSAPVSPEEAAEALRPAHAVFVLPEWTGADAEDRPLGRIRADDAVGIHLLVEHLLATGRQRFSYVNGPDIASNRLRRGSILRALEAQHVEPRIREFSASLDRAEIDAVARLAARERPDVLMCYDDKLALHLLDALRNVGLRVPQDVAVTGFDGIPFAAVANPRLTTIEQPAEQMGARAAEALIAAIESGAPPQDQLLPVRLAVRESSLSGRAGNG
ncbi:DNA-binding LacI/PurR family transcriptional regulator [Kaistia hirudinis]|uniref:DNA-binding LacI/PurR family transcriptional regulator n=2 Tax=Kaistia hirudinis TaxID=1293440 RepID=A0A840APB8_9HYPH|nr:DNA-binding LacI/PurR family transcriptional regulator [Kaistia hirudinis]